MLPDPLAPPPSLADLQELLSYDPQTGIFRWKTRQAKCIRRGAIAGSTNKDGYRRIQINGGGFFAHRLAWLWMTGEWPPSDVDHKNGVPGDDRFTNLRLASNSQNQGNGRRRKNNKSGMKGAYFRKDLGKFQATIKHNRKSRHLGYFDTAEEAHRAYVLEAQKIFGEFFYEGAGF